MGLQSDFTVGLAPETVYGTSVTPTRFYEADSSLKETVTTAKGRGYRPSQRGIRGIRSTIAKRESAGDIEFDAMSVGLGMLLYAFFGAVGVLTTPTGGTTSKQQIHTLLTQDFLPSFTIQQGIPRLGGTVDAYTFVGAQCTGLDITAKAGETVGIKSSWIAQKVRTDVAYAAASYPAAFEQFTFVGASLQLTSGAVTAATTTALATCTPIAGLNIREASLSLRNQLDDGGYNLGGSGTRARPAALKGGAEDIVKGSLTVEYTDPVLAAAYLAQSDLGLVLTFQGQVPIEATVYPVLQFVVPLIRLDGDLPLGNKGDVITVQHSFTGFVPASGPQVQAVYRSIDTVI